MQKQIKTCQYLHISNVSTCQYITILAKIIYTNTYHPNTYQYIPQYKQQYILIRYMKSNTCQYTHTMSLMLICTIRKSTADMLLRETGTSTSTGHCRLGQRSKEDSKEVVYVLPITSILGSMPVVRAEDMGIMQFCYCS